MANLGLRSDLWETPDAIHFNWILWRDKHDIAEAWTKAW